MIVLQFLDRLQVDASLVHDHDGGEGEGSRPAAGWLLGLPVALVAGPGPHDAAALVVQQTLRGKPAVVHPAHLFVVLRMELLVAPFSDVVAASKLVADAEHHPLVAHGKEVRTGDVLVQVHSFQGVGQEVAHMVPGRVQVAGLEHRCRVAAEDSVVGAVRIHPAVRIPGGPALAAGAAAAFVLDGHNRIGGRLAHLLQPVVAGRGDAVVPCWVPWYRKTASPSPWKQLPLKMPVSGLSAVGVSHGRWVFPVEPVVG